MQAMDKLAEAGLTVGTALMPALPFIGDRESELEQVIQATKDHGGTFVLGGGLTMEGVQAERTLEAYREYDPDLVERVRELYGWRPDGEPGYSPPAAYVARLGRTVRELCQRHGLLDRMPRYIPPTPQGANKRIAERLFLRTYELELQEARDRRIWAYRKAAWAVDEWPESVAEVFGKKGVAGLQELPNIGRSIAKQIARWLNEDAPQAGSGEG